LKLKVLLKKVFTFIINWFHLLCLYRVGQGPIALTAEADRGSKERKSNKPLNLYHNQQRYEDHPDYRLEPTDSLGKRSASARE
jgi:hypothetical protein